MPKSQTRWDHINGLRIFTRQWTGAPAGGLSVDALVLVHGLGVSSRYMVPIAKQMAPSLPVWAPDLPGFGRSQHPKDVYNISDQARFLCDWMDCMGIARAAILGNSLGCQVAARFALRYPERVDRMVLTGPTIDPRFRSYIKIVARAAVALLFEPARLYPLLLGGYLATGPRQMTEVLGYALDDPVEAFLAQVPQPVLVVRGEHDWIASQGWAEEITALVPDGRLEVIRGGGHAPNYDSPKALAKLLYEFLR